MPDNPEKGKAAEKLYANKYKSTEALEEGYWNSQQEGIRQRDRRVQVEAERDALKAQLAASPPGPSLEDTLRDADMPVNELNQLIEQKTMEQTQRVLQETLGPLTEAMTAQTDMATAYPDFDLQKVQRAVGNDPMVSEQYQQLLGTAPKAAYLMGYQAMKALEPAVTETVKPVNTPNPETEARRTNAGSPRSTGAGAGSPEGVDMADAETYDRLLQQGYNGDWTPFLRMRLGDLMDEHPDPTLRRPDPSEY